MRINKYLAQFTSLSRRAADQAIDQGRVAINGQTASLGSDVNQSDQVILDDKLIKPNIDIQTIMLNKPVDYVCSKKGQGSKTIYYLLPKELHHLNPIGRLDKDSSGLLIMTNDGDLAHKLSHPRHQKTKVYEVTLDGTLTTKNIATIQEGVELEDGLSQLQIKQLGPKKYEIKMHEGRNRQIRRTLSALNYKVTKLHRTQFDKYKLDKSSLYRYI